jgi:hypothetical protein
VEPRIHIEILKDLLRWISIGKQHLERRNPAGTSIAVMENTIHVNLQDDLRNKYLFIYIYILFLGQNKKVAILQKLQIKLNYV